MMMDIAANRRAKKWTEAELLARALWEVLSPLFRYSPRPLWGWRNQLLRVFGARIGRHVHICPTADIAVPWNLTVGDYSSLGEGARIYNLGPLTIGKSVTISQGAHLCGGTHDYTHIEFPLIKSPISIEDNAWVCADAFIGPGVAVGTHAIVGARAVAVADVDAWTIVAGNPAKAVRTRAPLTK